MQILPTIHRIIAGMFFRMAGTPSAAMMKPAGFGTPVSWSGLAHRGPPPAAGVITGPARLFGSKGPGRRDSHRAHVRLTAMNVNPRATDPDFTAQTAQEAKAARGRKARQRAAGN